ncbi:hypothetical protein ABZU32_02195 [Sphaerisporangium sp. NPDC005288]|uniref:hypothetical protein n=1 Tax=Sphaerisporangium sp. NPDC005288 TaxID=3155114 RepID=UPI0033BD6D27
MTTTETASARQMIERAARGHYRTIYTASALDAAARLLAEVHEAGERHGLATADWTGEHGTDHRLAEAVLHARSTAYRRASLAGLDDPHGLLSGAAERAGLATLDPPDTAPCDPRSPALDQHASSPDPRTASLDPRSASLDPRTASLDQHASSLDPRTASLDPRSASLDPREAGTEARRAAGDGPAPRARIRLARLPQTPPWGWDGSAPLVVSLERFDSLTSPGWKWELFPDVGEPSTQMVQVVAPPPSPATADEVLAVARQVLTGAIRLYR